MNAKMNTTSNTQIDNNDLRDLSRSEYAEVNGGRACYRYPRGTKNVWRFTPAGGNGAYVQQWNGRSYVTKWFQKGVDFGTYCKSRDHKFFY
jgi:hypothetical protein